MTPQKTVDKTQLRRSLLAQRRSLSSQAWQTQSVAICGHLSRWEPFQRARTVLSYFSFRQEPDLLPLYAYPKVWGFPRCVGSALAWHHWSLGEAWAIGSFGIREPHASAPMVDPGEVDLLLVPAVACDRRGYRLGYGGGFYDRLLSHPDWQHVPTVGIVFSFAHVPELPADPWDKPLQAVCSDAGLTAIADRGAMARNCDSGVATQHR